jgi:hypothetical protein
MGRPARVRQSHGHPVEAVAERDPPRLDVRGIVGDVTARGALAAILSTVQGPVSRDALRVFPTSEGLCRATDLLKAAGASGTMRVVVADGSTRLLAGAPIRVALTMPGFAGVVRLDYITDGGRLVVHLDQTRDPHERWKAHEQFAPGPQQDGVIGTVGEPYGTDVLLATVSQQALLSEVRPAEEPAEAYLRVLQTTIADAVRLGQLVAADATVLETAAY